MKLSEGALGDKGMEMQLWVRLNSAPHKNYSPENGKVDFRGAFIAIWTGNYDCGHETEYWYCIKDDLLDISAMKAKRRYEINKGNKNFTTRVINPAEYADEIYHVYVESLKGYQRKPTPVTREQFQKRIIGWSSSPECCFFGAFEKESGKLCGYSDVYLRTPYLPISSLKTIPEYERGG